MLFLLLVLAFSVGVAGRQTLHQSYRNCSVTRESAANCAITYGDGDGNRELCPNEIRSLKSNVLDIVEKFVALFYSIEKIMRDCDIDGDNRITQYDMDNNARTCLIHCADAQLLFYCICDPAAARNYKPKRVQCEPKTEPVPIH
jgi:phosphoribosyl-dephospho-CoA transferase